MTGQNLWCCLCSQEHLPDFHVDCGRNFEDALYINIYMDSTCTKNIQTRSPHLTSETPAPPDVKSKSRPPYFCIREIDPNGLKRIDGDEALSPLILYLK